MNMSNNEKDDFIKKALETDTFMAGGDEVKSKIKKVISVSKIKQKKYTYGERRFMKFLGVIFIICLLSNGYVIKNNTSMGSYAKDNETRMVKNIENENTIKERKNIEYKN